MMAAPCGAADSSDVRGAVRLSPDAQLPATVNGRREALTRGPYPGRRDRAEPLARPTRADSVQKGQSVHPSWRSGALVACVALSLTTFIAGGCGADGRSVRPSSASPAPGVSPPAAQSTGIPAAAPGQTASGAASPSGRIDIGGRSLDLRCVGDAGPTIVFENDLDRDSTSWSKVVSAFDRPGRLCVYDRAGIGVSDPAPPRAPSKSYPAEVWMSPGPGLRTNLDAADDLHRLLIEAGLAPPYILVAHGFGALDVTAYEDLFPGDVAGVVLADPEPPAWYAVACQKLSSAECATLNRIGSGNREGIDVLASQVATMGTYAPVPTTVVFASKRDYPGIPPSVAPTLDPLWRDTVEGVISDKARGARFIVAEGAGHDIPAEQPDALVRAIEDVLDSQSSNPWPIAAIPLYPGETRGLRCPGREMDLTETWCQGFHAVAVGSRGAVAVGRSGADAFVATSADGRSWAAVAAEESFSGGTMLALAQFRDRLVAVGAGYAVDRGILDESGLKDAMSDVRARSWIWTDATSWTQSADDPSLEGGTMWSLAGTGDRLVAIGAVTTDRATPAIWTSTDGLAWALASTPATSGSEPWRLMDVASDGTSFVAVGGGNQWSTTTNPLIWLSGDGLRWEAAPLDARLAGARLLSIAHGPAGFVAVGSVGRGEGVDVPRPTIWFSGDGRRWEEVGQPNIGSTAHLVGVVAGADGYTAWTSSTNLFPPDLQLWRSPDGRTWTQTYQIEYSGISDWYAIAPTPGGLVIVGLSWSVDFAAQGTNAAVWITPPWASIR